MALAGKKAPQHGWRHQAERLAMNHTGVATAAWAATERRPITEPVSCHFSVPGAKSERDQETSANETSSDAKHAEEQMAREAAAAWILNAREKTLAARAAKAKAADERIAELEARFDTALERIAFQDNENQSLQTSFDLTVSENFRLSNRLSESDATLEKISLELEQLKTSEAERSSVVDKQIELLQNLLQVKERRVQKLEQARSKLMDDTKKLLRTCAKRDQALARAEERIISLTELFAQLETKIELATVKKKPAGRDSRVRREQSESATAEGPGKMTLPKIDLWKRELDCDEWLLGRGRG